MKSELIRMIRILGVGCRELVIDIDLGIVIVNSVEFRDPESVYVHHFTDEGFDFEMEFDEIDPKHRRIIFNSLSGLLYN